MNLKDWNPGVKSVYHPFNFRGWWDFGSGALGDMGCHHFNTPFRALRLGAPIRVEASATKVFAESPPLAAIITLDFPARAGMPAVRTTWHDGGLKPPTPRAFAGQPWPSAGTLYIGDHGCLLSTWEGIKVMPEAAAKQRKARPKPWLADRTRGLNGSTLAAEANPRAATSTWPTRSPKQCCWAMLLCGRASDWIGIQPP